MTTFLLSSQNVFQYLIEQGLCIEEEQSLGQIESRIARNFNLLLNLSNDRKLLVKQERFDWEGKTEGSLLNECQVQEFLQQFPEISSIRSLISEIVHIDEKHSIVVYNYLSDYQDLDEFYTEKNLFPIAIAASIGTALATVHSATIDNQNYQDFFSKDNRTIVMERANKLGLGQERIGPEIFGLVPKDGLKFFVFYQRYESLRQAIAELAVAYEPCCLTHNDLKLNNILLQNEWEQLLSAQKQPSNSIIRIIDWENSTWGDPAFDLGTLIASYLEIWLDSLVVNKSINIEDALRLATTPLEELQPSITAMTNACFNQENSGGASVPSTL